MTAYLTHYHGFIVVDEGRPRGKLASRGDVVLSAEWCEMIEPVIDDWWMAQDDLARAIAEQRETAERHVARLMERT